jgi:hypothetical protein
MVRALVDVATANYDRWYILAHSLGTVVAFNGLMTHAHSFPNYLDERRWRRLCRLPRWVGPPRPHKHERIEEEDPTEAQVPTKVEIPPRPLWIGDGATVVYRDKFQQVSRIIHLRVAPRQIRRNVARLRSHKS